MTTLRMALYGVTNLISKQLPSTCCLNSPVSLEYRNLRIHCFRKALSHILNPSRQDRNAGTSHRFKDFHVPNHPICQ